ncbi:hypothetical protein [Pollutibacter soli]|uniref:hypothetical protein n=1 Tax=Pollutibacter soli TaxID=3034157 RepID=UPI0030132934
MTEKARTFGLVLTGVSNEPFSEDAAWLRHHGKPQLYFVFDLLSEICEKVFIVCDKIQKNRIFSYYPSIVVKKENTLEYLPVVNEFFKQNPGSGLLVTGTCFPDLTRKELGDFYAAIDPSKPIAIFDPVKVSFQPLIAYYPPESKYDVEKSIADGIFSASEFLEKIDAIKFILPSDISIHSFNRNEPLSNSFSMFIPPKNSGTTTSPGLLRR